MKNPFKIAFLCFCLSAVAITGCVTANPEHETNPTAPAFIPDAASISNAAYVAKTVSGAVPGNVYKVPIDLGIDTAAALALGISTLVAWLRSRKQNSSLDKQLAATTQVIENASNAADLKTAVKQLTSVAGVEADLNKRLNS